MISTFDLHIQGQGQEKQRRLSLLAWKIDQPTIWRKSSSISNRSCVVIEWVVDFIGASVAQWLGHWLLVLRVRVSIPRSPITFRYLFLGPLRITQSVHLHRAGLEPINVGSFPTRTFGFNCVITSGKGYVCTSCPSLPSYPSLRGRVNWYRR